MATRGTVRVSELQRLLASWRHQQLQVEALQTDRSVDIGVRKRLQVEARVLHDCRQELMRVIEGTRQTAAHATARRAPAPREDADEDRYLLRP